MCCDCCVLFFRLLVLLQNFKLPLCALLAHTEMLVSMLQSTCYLYVAFGFVVRCRCLLLVVVNSLFSLSDPCCCFVVLVWPLGVR